MHGEHGWETAVWVALFVMLALQLAVKALLYHRQGQLHRQLVSIMRQLDVVVQNQPHYRAAMRKLDDVVALLQRMPAQKD